MHDCLVWTPLVPPKCVMVFHSRTTQMRSCTQTKAFSAPQCNCSRALTVFTRRPVQRVEIPLIIICYFLPQTVNFALFKFSLLCLFSISTISFFFYFFWRAWIIHHCSLSALVVRCMIKSQWRERLGSLGAGGLQALFSAPAAKHASYVRSGGGAGQQRRYNIHLHDSCCRCVIVRVLSPLRRCLNNCRACKKSHK